MNNNRIDFRSKIHHNFKVLHDYQTYISKNQWKAKAYATAVRILENEGALTTIQTIEQISTLNLSKAMVEKATWIVLNNQNLPEVDEVIATGNLLSIQTLTEVHNIGASKAADLVTKHNIKTIDQLENNTHLLNDLQKNGLHFHRHIIQRIPRYEMDLHSEFIHRHINSFCNIAKVEIEICITGSYRRCESTSGDIDVLVCPRADKAPSNVCKNIVQHLKDSGYVPENGVFALGKKKFMGMCKLPDKNVYRRLDLIVTTPSELPFMMLYFTGNGEFNVKMREIAKRKGYLLNECGLFIGSNKVDHIFSSEEDIFAFLRLEYVLPCERYPERLTAIVDSQ